MDVARPSARSAESLMGRRFFRVVWSLRYSGLSCQEGDDKKEGGVSVRLKRRIERGPTKSCSLEVDEMVGREGFLGVTSPGARVEIAAASSSLVVVERVSSKRAKTMFSSVRYHMCRWMAEAAASATFLSTFLNFSMSW